MTVAVATVPLVVFEAADCLMALPASEVDQFVHVAPPDQPDNLPACDLGEYFGEPRADGPWLRWVRGTRGAWLCVRRVIDVVAVPITAFRPLPQPLQRRSCVFVAAGTSGDDVFLLLDAGRLTLDGRSTRADRPTVARLRAERFGVATAGER
jgi:hypothetical protein